MILGQNNEPRLSVAIYDISTILIIHIIFLNKWKGRYMHLNSSIVNICTGDLGMMGSWYIIGEFSLSLPCRKWTRRSLGSLMLTNRLRWRRLSPRNLEQNREQKFRWITTFFLDFRKSEFSKSLKYASLLAAKNTRQVNLGFFSVELNEGILKEPM